MENKRLLQAFYLISKELEENLIKLERLDIKLKYAQDHSDFNQAQILLKEYKKLNMNISDLKNKAQQLKSKLDL